jgi:hypothetical protein
MPAKYVRRNPDTPAQVWDERTPEEMAAALRNTTGLPHVGPVVRVDEKTVRLRDVTVRGAYRLEFDLYEGWYEAGFTTPSPSTVAGATWMGCPMAEYQAAPESVQKQAQYMVEAERETALRVAAPLLSAVRELEVAFTTTPSPYSQSWYGQRYEPIMEILLEVLGRLCDGSPERARSILHRALTTDTAIDSIVSTMESGKFHVEHRMRTGPVVEVDLYQVARLLREQGVRAGTASTGSGLVSLYAGGEPDDERYVLVVGPGMQHGDNPGAIAKTSELWIGLDCEDSEGDGRTVAQEGATTTAEVAEVIIRCINDQQSRNNQSD